MQDSNQVLPENEAFTAAWGRGISKIDYVMAMISTF
jgi:hypothetical protein